MTAILTLIYCWLQEFFFSLTDWGLGMELLPWEPEEQGACRIAHALAPPPA